ncbi:MAG: class I SAM-dependent methyltransferase [Candidatus Methanoperedens sp.]
MKLYDLRNAPKCPYGDLKWNKYYWEYPRDVPTYESDYWGSVKDPDGQVRNMQSEEEWEKQIEDLRFIIGKIHELPAGKILDIGCGPGFLLSVVDASWVKHGVDVSSVAMESARKFAIVKKGEFPDLGYEQDYFDVVVMNHVIEHVPNPVAYVQACRRVLKPKGIFIVATPDFDSGCARFFNNNYRMLHDKGHISLFTSFSLVKMLEDFKFRVLEVEYPFFETRWFTKENLLRMLDNLKVSPPFYGNHVIVLAEKPKFI